MLKLYIFQHFNFTLMQIRSKPMHWSTAGWTENQAWCANLAKITQAVVLHGIWSCIHQPVICPGRFNVFSWDSCFSHYHICNHFSCNNVVLFQGKLVPINHHRDLPINAYFLTDTGSLGWETKISFMKSSNDASGSHFKSQDIIIDKILTVTTICL